MDGCKSSQNAAASAAAACARRGGGGGHHNHDGPALGGKGSRKIAKPIMEKKRRARINASLNELKTLLVEVLQKEGCRHSSKMEKADILELTVKHLRQLQKHQQHHHHQQQQQQTGAGHAADAPGSADKFSSGYNECLSAVTDYLRAAAATAASSGHESALAAKLLDHLSCRAQELAERPRSGASATAAATKVCDPAAVRAQLASSPTGATAAVTSLAAATASATAAPAAAARVPLAGKAAVPSGEMTLLLPQSAFMNATATSYLIPAVYAAAAAAATNKMAAAAAAAAAAASGGCKQEPGQSPVTMISFNCLNGGVQHPGVVVAGGGGGGCGGGPIPTAAAAAVRPPQSTSPMWRPW